MAFAKFERNRFRIDGEIAENHAILVNLTASYEYNLASIQWYWYSGSLVWSSLTSTGICL